VFAALPAGYAVPMTDPQTRETKPGPANPRAEAADAASPARRPAASADRWAKSPALRYVRTDNTRRPAVRGAHRLELFISLDGDICTPAASRPARAVTSR